jgi:hypothetical protein
MMEKPCSTGRASPGPKSHPLRSSASSSPHSSSSSLPSLASNSARLARPARAPLYELKDVDFRRPSRTLLLPHVAGAHSATAAGAHRATAAGERRPTAAVARPPPVRTQLRSLSQPPERAGRHSSGELDTLAGVCPTKLSKLSGRRKPHRTGSYSSSDGYRCAHFQPSSPASRTARVPSVTAAAVGLRSVLEGRSALYPPRGRCGAARTEAAATRNAAAACPPWCAS